MSKPDSVAYLISACRDIVLESSRSPLLAEALRVTERGGSEFELALGYFAVRAPVALYV